MNPLLLLGGGGLIAYLLLRHQDADAAALAPPPRPGMQPPPWQPAPRPPPPDRLAPFGGGAQAPKPIAPQVPPSTKPSPSTKPPQITTPAPPFTGEIAVPNQPIQLAGRWGWPVPRWQGRAPVISDGFGSPRPPGKHMGVDLMFGRISSDPFPIGPNGSKAFIMPDAWMAVSASDGVLWSAGHTPRGFAIVIDHGNIATFYQHLETLLIPEAKPPAKGTPRDQLIQIKTGQPLGVIGADPLDPAHLKHLHFELWLGSPANAIDPQPLMKIWQVFTPTDIAPLLSPLTRNAARKRPENRHGLVPVRAHQRRWPGAALYSPR